MFKNNIGVYIQRIYENNPDIDSKVLQWHTRLEIEDVDLFIMRNHELGVKELVLGYRQIYVNTYNVKLFNISKPASNNCVYTHESHHLYEFKI